MKRHKDPAHVIVTELGEFAPNLITALTGVFNRIVNNGHELGEIYVDKSGSSIPKAQIFEEGKVYLGVQPGANFPTHAYFMNMTDVKKIGVCTRMHIHTGPRLGYMAVGMDTTVRFASLSQIYNPCGVVISLPEIVGRRTFHVLTIKSGQFVSLQIPTGVSHQFNAHGENAVMLSVHVEDHHTTKFKQLTMVGQTTFLQKNRDEIKKCEISAPLS